MMIDQAFPIGEIIEKGILEIDKMDWGLVECMTDIGETKQPRLSEYCPVCKKLMKFSKGIGHYCCHGDSGLLYNPKSGEAYDESDFRALRVISGGRRGNTTQLHLRDAGIEAELVSLIKDQIENGENRQRITKLFAEINWPPYDYSYSKE